MLDVMQELIRIIDHASPKMWSLIRQTLKGAIDRELKTMSGLMEEVRQHSIRIRQHSIRHLLAIDRELKTMSGLMEEVPIQKKKNSLRPHAQV
jgi:hypothetical protein